MSKHLKVLLIMVIAGSLFSQVNGQTKPKETPKKTTKPKTAPAKKQEIRVIEQEEVLEPPPPPPPPPMEELQKAKIDVMMADSSAFAEPVFAFPDSASFFAHAPVPMVDFDTSAVVEDAFSKDIIKLLTVTNALNLGLAFAEEMKTADIENNPMLKAFYARFMDDMKSGTTRRWFERTFVREYKNMFTHEEIQELLKFYDSPLGRKVVRSTHEMLPGVMRQGKKIGEYIGMRIYYQMMKEGKN